jgi:hypothetical protein
MPALTLHQGEAERTFEQHPTETARKALIAAAEVEEPRFADQLRRFAAAFPARRVASLTLHQGDESRKFEEHPLEVARKALMAASELDPHLASRLRSVAALLPERGRTVKAAE